MCGHISTFVLLESRCADVTRTVNEGCAVVAHGLETALKLRTYCTLQRNYVVMVSYFELKPHGGIQCLLNSTNHFSAIRLLTPYFFAGGPLVEGTSSAGSSASVRFRPVIATNQSEH